MAFVQRWKYTITLVLTTLAVTLLVAVTEPGNWWVPPATVAALMVIAWPGWHRRR